MPSAQDIIKKLNLEPHPEKGYFVETFRDPDCIDGRPKSTAIYYLLEKDVISHWHRVTDAVEIWHYYTGAALQLFLSYDDGKPVRKRTLGPDIFENQEPHIAVQKNEWQRAESLGDWTLVGCTVAPGFVPEAFVMAEPDWEPRQS